MTVDDIPQVLEIERESFPSMWPPTAFKRELQQNRLANYIVLIEHNSQAAAEPSDQEPQRHAAHLGRIFGELRSFLGPREERVLAPVAERPELIVGFIGVWMLPDEAHIVTVAVRDSHRRQGLGELLLISAIDLAHRQKQPLLTLEVRVSNAAAVALYEKYGFEQVGLRPRYYSDNHEDAYVLTVHSILTEKYAARLAELRSEHRRRWGDFDLSIG
jgi:ribosomal-protein-alanine N-acetyltransferase